MSNANTDIAAVISGDEILFPNGYYFKAASIYKSRTLSVRNINEIHTYTHPASCVVNNNEIIFLPKISCQDLLAFARTYNIPHPRRADIWELINTPFLDTEMDELEAHNVSASLIENGVSKDEITAIRKRIHLPMLALCYLTWEWVYMGHYDYLRSVVLTPKKYWWSMEIALRNYKTKHSDQ